MLRRACFTTARVRATPTRATHSATSSPSQWLRRCSSSSSPSFLSPSLSSPLWIARRYAVHKGRIPAPEITHYSLATRWVHAVSGAAMFACVALVLAAQQLPGWGKCTPEERERKVSLMYFHKSCGLLSLALLFPRLFVRLTATLPEKVPGIDMEQMFARMIHRILYSLIIALPVTGFVMGYAGDKGLPFFVTTFRPMSGEFGKAANAELAGQAYQVHSLAGQTLEVLVPLHVGAAFVHYFRGTTGIFSRISPFA